MRARHLLAAALASFAVMAGGIVAGLLQAFANAALGGDFLSPGQTFGVVWVAAPIAALWAVVLPFAIAWAAYSIWKDA